MNICSSDQRRDKLGEDFLFIPIPIVMYAIWHIRPHSRFAGPSLSLTLWPPNLSLDGPTYLPAAFAASLLYLCDLFTLAEIRAPAPDRRRIHSLFRRDTGDTEWLESDRRPLILAVFNQLLLKLIFQRDSFWRAVGRHWRHSHREKLSLDEESSRPTSTQGFRLSSESADQTRHWHCVRAVKQTFIVVLAAVICTTVAAVLRTTVVVVGFAVLPPLNAPLLVFALLL